MYDWANSAYITTVAAGVLPAYFASVVAGPGTLRVLGFETTAPAVWAFVVALASLLVFVCAPVLGAIADYSGSKKKFLMAFGYAGALIAILLSFSGSGDVYRTLILFMGAQIGYFGSLVFYDAFVTHIASPEKLDWLSGKGYSYGYVGGGLQFALSLALVARHEYFGISEIAAVRIAILTAGLWWAGFALVPLRYLRENKAETRTKLSVAQYLRLGIARTIRTTRRVRQFRHLATFLLAFMLYNDGIDTVIAIAASYATAELKLPIQTLMVTLLIIQMVAIGGALLFGKLAVRIGTKHAIMLALLVWSGIVVFAYFMQTGTEFMVLGAFAGLVLGGSQALSRSFYASMVPPAASAEFFGFYTVFSKFSAIWGPAAFGVVAQVFGSARLAILSLIVFFVAGLALLAFVDERKAREAKEWE